MMKRWKKSLAFAGALVALVTSLAAPAAAAYPPAYNTKTQYLTGNMNDSHPVSCVERQIYLAEGRYNWHWQWGANDTDVIRTNFYLGAGVYSWKDCLDPDGWGAYGKYIHTSYLFPHNPSWTSVNSEIHRGLVASTTVTGGSSLRPQF